MPSCPNCQSPAIQATTKLVSNVGAAVVGSLMFGLAAGNAVGHTSRVMVVCLNCGLQYAPGSYGEHYIRAMAGHLGEEAKQEAMSTGSPEEVAARAWKEDVRRRRNMLLVISLCLTPLVLFMMWCSNP
jgi:hypothetical protein